MSTISKSILSAVAAVSTYYFVFWIPGSFLRAALPDEGFGWVIFVVSLISALLVASILWKVLESDSKGALSKSFKWAIITGGVGFALGFFGPLLFSPGANQGPMLGLFVTGPGGFIAGGIGGLCKWYFKDRQAN